MKSTILTNEKFKICLDYYNHLLVSSRKPKSDSLPYSHYIFKGYRYFTLFLFFNFFNSLDNIKYKYFNGINTFIKKGYIYLYRKRFFNSINRNFKK